MSKKSLFKSLIPSLIAVSFASWGGMALADFGESGDLLGDACKGSQLIAGFNFPGSDEFGNLNAIVKLTSGEKPEAIDIDGSYKDIPPYPWKLVPPYHGITIHSIELLVLSNDGTELIVDQDFSPGPYPKKGFVPKTDIDPRLILQVYFCGEYLLVEMSDATVELASGKTTFSVDPVSEMKEEAVSYKAVCTAESNPINADGRTNYEVNAYENGIKCHIEELDQNGKTFDHEAAIK